MKHYPSYDITKLKKKNCLLFNYLNITTFIKLLSNIYVKSKIQRVMFLDNIPEELPDELRKLIIKWRTKESSVHAQEKFGGILSIIKEAKAHKIELNQSTFDVLILETARAYAFYEGLSFPNFVLEFVEEYLRNVRPKTILNPWASFGLNLIHLTKTLGLTKAIGLVRHQEEYEVAKLLDTEARVDWKICDPSIFSDTISDKFDLVISR